MAEKSTNFGFLLDGHELVLHQLALGAERAFAADPNTTILKCRQLAEAFAQHAAAACGVWSGPGTHFADLVRALEARGVVAGDAAVLFRQLRMAGNHAAHSFTGEHRLALDQLRFAHKLAVWFHRTFGPLHVRGGFKAAAFAPPEDPSAKLRALEEAVQAARAEAEAHKAAASAAKALLEAEEQRRQEAEAAAKREAAERADWESLAAAQEAEHHAQLALFQQQLATLQASAAKDEQQQKVHVAQAIVATTMIELDESDTRKLIDAQLRQAGWEADSSLLRFSKGARPAKGTNRVIAEWPTSSGPADYVFFVGLTPVAVCEAKKIGKRIVADLSQAQRYSRDFTDGGVSLVMPPTTWPSSSDGDKDAKPYRVPFLYSANGREYLKQFELESGVWFHDVREPGNHARALAGWHTPEHLSTLLQTDAQHAHAALKQEPTEYLGLREYQLRAIRAVEDAVAQGQRSVLVAMATGTGKTKTTIGLLYRLLKAKRFERILFLVDREALGVQAQNAFKEMRLESNQTFAEIYEVKELTDKAPERETKVHVATVQGMVKRILGADEGDEVPIDRYDCIVVDESHRGYTLDREMSEGESETRSFLDYVSTYRRVLDHFDAVKIGLTATPALHTREIFGAPVFTYTYREAVIDGWLVDHEPPLRLVTKLAASGIHFEKGEQVAVLQTSKVAGARVQLSLLPDQLDFDVDDFHRRVINENFTRVVCEELAQHLDPESKEKTLVFAVNDRHADIVVEHLKRALSARWGSVSDGVVQKITGSIDRPMEAIRRFKNEAHPNIVVTVDLLTTGIDVPTITNLVFLRRVRSRILYEQMLGRATRLCDEIGKTVFRIYDAVDLYAALEPVSSMKPVVKNVSFTLGQLVGALVEADDRRTPSSAPPPAPPPAPPALPAPPTDEPPAAESPAPPADVSADALSDSLSDTQTVSDEAFDELFDEVIAKIRRGLRAAMRTPPTGDKASAIEGIETLLGCSLLAVPDKLQELGAGPFVHKLRETPDLLPLLERVLRPVGAGGIVLSEHDDAITTREHGYGEGMSRPEDYLDAFEKFIRENMNTLPALTVVAQRPRSLTREQLRELKLKLDAAGFTESRLQTAWRDLKNQDIAATIIGFIRQRALGSPLVPYGERVDRALRVVEGLHPWTPAERKWLVRIADQLKHETIVDEGAFQKGAFDNAGGFKGVNQKLGGRLQQVLDTFGDAIWHDGAA
jgi:type I restriction enzyme R subunit